jgi:hypothetical protein
MKQNQAMNMTIQATGVARQAASPFIGFSIKIAGGGCGRAKLAALPQPHLKEPVGWRPHYYKLWHARLFQQGSK